MSTHPSNSQREALRTGDLCAVDFSLVAEAARGLQKAFAEGRVQPLLRGHRFGLLCEDDRDADATFFRRAAEELGAHVAHIRTSLTELSTPVEVQRTAVFLGRLYDALECQNLAPALVLQVREHAGVPVYQCMASSARSLVGLVSLPGRRGAAKDQNRFLLQAALLRTVLKS